MKKPLCTLVGIAGGSGSGKTTVAERVAAAVGVDKVATLSLDSYYKDVSRLSAAERRTHNFDQPNAFDVATLVLHLKRLKAGHPIPKVEFEYKTGRQIIGTELIQLRSVVLLEGILVLAIPAVEELLDVKIFVESAPDTRFIRRARREINLHERTFDDIAAQYEKHVREMHRLLIEPSRDYADWVLPFDKSGERGLDMLIRSVASLVAQQPSRTLISERDQAEMILVPSGDFLMGTNDEHVMQLMRDYDAQIHWFNDERPIHTVKLGSFYIDKYPVTNRQYAKFLRETGHKEPELWREPRYDHLDYPVVGVTWSDAEEYCKWAGKRLPTEAEWEKAARGVNARLFPWGSESPEGRANYGGKYRGPTPVNKFPDGASPYGVMDMAGNVWEWVRDLYDRDYYSRLIGEDPKGPATGVGNVVRGGGWVNNPTMLRCAERDRRREPHRDLKYFGFRCALDLDES